MTKDRKLKVNETSISVLVKDETDFISLTDMTLSFTEGSGLIGKWITNKNTLEYLGTWERINNPNFNYPEFGVIGNEAGINRFVMSVGQWMTRTNAMGLMAKVGRYGGTYAHKDIAFHFAMWLSPEFQIYLVKEFQRLKEDENNRLKLEWNLLRTLSKVNYHIHTDAIKEKLLPAAITTKQANFTYASEADLLNVALFGITSKDWREANSALEGNIRDHATIEQLVVLSNLESLNAVLIHQGILQSNRLLQLNQIAISQMRSLLNSKSLNSLK